MGKASLLYFGLLFYCANVLADVQSLYGLGAWNTSLAGANRTEAKEAFMSSYNPAVMSFTDESVFSLGFLSAFDNFNSINSVVVSNEYIGGTTNWVNGDSSIAVGGEEISNFYSIFWSFGELII